MSQQTHHMRLFIDLILIELDLNDNPDNILNKFKAASDLNKINVYMLQSIMSDQDANNKVKIDNSYVLCAKLVLNLNEELASKSIKSLICKLNETVLQIKPNFPNISSIRVFLDNEYEVSPSEVIKNILYENENVTIVGISKQQVIVYEDQNDSKKSSINNNYSTKSNPIEPKENKHRKGSKNYQNESYSRNTNEKVKDTDTIPNIIANKTKPQEEFTNKTQEIENPDIISNLAHHESKKHKQKRKFNTMQNNSNIPNEQYNKNSGKKRKNKNKKNKQHQNKRSQKLQEKADEAESELNSSQAAYKAQNLFNLADLNKPKFSTSSLKNSKIEETKGGSNSNRKQSHNDHSIKVNNDNENENDNDNNDSSSSMSSISEQEDDADEFKMLWKGVETSKDHEKASRS